MADQETKKDDGFKNLNQVEMFYFEPQNKNSSLGVMTLSQLKTEPIYGMGTAERRKILKQFLNNEMAKTIYSQTIQIGKESVGPNYDVTDNFDYNRAPTHAIGTQLRRDHTTEAKYDHYFREDIDSDAIEADHFRKPRPQTTKIGLESRFPSNPKSMRGTPGPQYNPSLKPEVPNSDKFTFGYRRDYPGFSCLQPLISTPNVVGPGAYIIQKRPDTSNIVTKPKYSFTKAKRAGLENPDFTLHQTYSYVHSVGKQNNSKKTTAPQINIGKEKRSAKTGHFKQTMAQPRTMVRICMPK